MEKLKADATTFDELIERSHERLVVVDFYGPNCPNCEEFERALPDLMAALSDADADLIKMDAYAHPDIAGRYGIFGVPTFVLIRNGEVLGKMSRFYGADYWKQVVLEHL
jgi:thioredoxin-like negative regulator of GroEL